MGNTSSQIKTQDKCMTVPFGVTAANGVDLTAQLCNKDVSAQSLTNSNQGFTYDEKTKEIKYGNYCLDLADNSTTNGTKIQLWNCDAGTNQKWNFTTNGITTDINPNKCIDFSSTNSDLIISECNKGKTQAWKLFTPPTNRPSQSQANLSVITKDYPLPKVYLTANPATTPPPTVSPNIIPSTTPSITPQVAPIISPFRNLQTVISLDKQVESRLYSSTYKPPMDSTTFLTPNYNVPVVSNPLADRVEPPNDGYGIINAVTTLPDLVPTKPRIFKKLYSTSEDVIPIPSETSIPPANALLIMSSGKNILLPAHIYLPSSAAMSCIQTEQIIALVLGPLTAVTLSSSLGQQSTYSNNTFEHDFSFESGMFANHDPLSDVATMIIVTSSGPERIQTVSDSTVDVGSGNVHRIFKSGLLHQQQK
jgi:hypothetical protein